MSRVQRRMCLLLVATVVGAAGCSSETATPTTTAPTDAPAAPAAPTLKPDVPQTPEAAVKAIVDGLKASKPIAAWDALPDAGQRSWSRRSAVRSLESIPRFGSVRSPI